jgi:hypothetical protein
MFLSHLYIHRSHNLIFQPPDMTPEAIQRIDLLPMAQRLEMKDKTEDWTGKSNTAERRKLQNRLNQRAARKQAEIETAAT